MFKLPFYIDGPLIAGVITLLACLFFVFLRWAYNRNIWRIGDALGWFFDHQFGVVGPEKAQRYGKGFLLAMVIIFGAIALFGIAVGTGLIENGDSSAQITFEEFIERQSSRPTTKPVSESGIISLYHQLKTGMTRSQVEAIVGEPLHSLRQPSGEEQCDYIKEPERIMESHEAPMMPSGISVTYKDGKLIEKMYNPQWVKREHREAYEQRKNS